jgi:hypothetical protein
MRCSSLAMAAIGLAACAAPHAAAQPKGGPNGAAYGWLSSLEQGKAQARKSGKPLMVVIRCVP